jgi:hypothetical protein
LRVSTSSATRGVQRGAKCSEYAPSIWSFESLRGRQHYPCFFHPTRAWPGRGNGGRRHHRQPLRPPGDAATPQSHSQLDGGIPASGYCDSLKTSHAWCASKCWASLLV